MGSSLVRPQVRSCPEKRVQEARQTQIEHVLSYLVRTTVKFQTMDAEQQSHWEATQKRGKASYIWRDGVLGFGVPLSLALFAADVVFNWIDGTPTRWVAEIIKVIVMLPLLGVSFGLLNWSKHQREYRRGKSV